MNLFALLWALAWAVASVSAYDLYGGYERIIYYNAYRMDWGKTGGDTNRMSVGSGCVSKKGAKTPCDLIEFVDYINVWSPLNQDKRPIKLQGLPAGFDPLDMKPAHVDAVAKSLRNAGVTGAYDCVKVHKEVKGRNDVDGLFGKIGQFIQGAQHANGVPANAVESAKNAVSVWADLRKWAQQLAFADYLKKKFPDAFKNYQPAFKDIGGTGEKVETLNPRSAIPAIRALPGQERYNVANDWEEFKAADPGHSEKVDLADRVKGGLC
ncbi:hypothetical protein B0T16DRAFT_488869 [Cercophora newfieldiana]|uniref:Uncharacterized protein n=1 Tax=Cercophora newfieldiana TaxID=92897 RepID=A0AA39YSF6_9PEZI|nr:hypothetical protein B0T16DRAFT_488869 [Cercophora newfieldiana]